MPKDWRANWRRDNDFRATVFGNKETVDQIQNVIKTQTNVDQTVVFLYLSRIYLYTLQTHDCNLLIS